jgi:hypothetical protein
VRGHTAAAAVLLALALTGCETTAQKSAQLEKAAKHGRIAQAGLSIAKASADVTVRDAVLLHGAEGAAVVVTLRNSSARALQSVPIAITVKNAAGGTLFQNNAPGLEAALTSIASLGAHDEATWVDDQVPATGSPASVSAVVGEAPAARGSAPRLRVAGVHATEEAGSAGAAGTVKNESQITQQSLVVYVLARRAGRVVAAGRAVLPEVAAGAAVPFQAFFTGVAKGAQLQASAPPSTFG